jgi:ABC-2 type transport system ATP-binding protein
MWAIECNSLSKRFRRVEAVHELNLQIPEGAIYALMGPNGAGKTTLIKMLMNLVRPSSGEASILGGDCRALAGRSFASIGYVSENQKLPDWMSIGQYIAYWRPFYPKWDRALEAELLRRFELPVKQKLKHLSRGMRMKAQLAGALAYHPRVVILDEPLSGLDPLVRDELMETLRALATEATVLLSSHDLAEIDNFATHLGFIDGGKLQLSAPMEAVHERFRRVRVSGIRKKTEAAPPAEWLKFERDEKTAIWIETNFDAEPSGKRVQDYFGKVKVESEPLGMREVFLALTKANDVIKGAVL